MLVFLILLVGSLALVALRLWARKRKTSVPYPPGPESHFFFGNLWNIPKERQWLEYTKWRKEYGDIMHLNILGQHLIILNSETVAKDLIERRSYNYSDRPSIGVMQINGWNVNMGLKHYGDEWRRDRRVMHQKLRAQNAEELHPLELNKVRVLLQSMLHSPSDFKNHFQVYPASVIMQLMYGYEATREDSLVDLTIETIWLFSGAVFPGSNLLNIFPALKYVPDWIPLPVLQPLLRRCAKSRSMLTQLQDIPFDWVKKNREQHKAVPCWVSELLDKNETDEEKLPEEVMKAMGVSMFAAAMETTSAILETFTLAMILFPETQKRAHAEIDAVVGNSRLPTFEDRSSLPYIDALMRELFRWHGPAPLGIPHAVVRDDIYKGYLIPKGSTIIYNHWAMWRDERVYERPDVFMPERFLTDKGSLIAHLPPTYGYGRRICIGRSMGDAMTWIAIASILSMFNIEKATDESGNKIPVFEDYGDGVVSAPHEFSSSITPRDERSRNLIMDNPPITMQMH